MLPTQSQHLRRSDRKTESFKASLSYIGRPSLIKKCVGGSLGDSCTQWGHREATGRKQPAPCLRPLVAELGEGASVVHHFPIALVDWCSFLPFSASSLSFQVTWLVAWDERAFWVLFDPSSSFPVSFLHALLCSVLGRCTPVGLSCCVFSCCSRM